MRSSAGSSVFASSVDAAGFIRAVGDFGVIDVTESLASELFLMRLQVGALFAGHIPETIG